MSSSSHGVVADAKNGDETGGAAGHVPITKVNKNTSTNKMEMSGEELSSDTQQPDDGFTTVMSKRAKAKLLVSQKAAQGTTKEVHKAQEATTMAKSKQARPPQEQQQRQQQKQRPSQQQQQQSGGATKKKKKYTHVDILIFQLADCVRKKADTAQCMAMFMHVQRATRSLRAELAAEQAGEYTRTYKSGTAEDVSALMSTLRDWFVVKRLSRAEFRKRLLSIRLDGPEPKAVDAKVSWKQKLFHEPGDQAASNGDEVEMESVPWTDGRPTWKREAESLTHMELETLTEVLHGTTVVDRPPAFLGKKSTIPMHAFVSAVIEKTTRGVLVAQLEAGMRFYAKLGWHGLLRLIHDVTMTQAERIAAFKAAVVFAYYDEDSNTIAFTLRSEADAVAWEGARLPIQGRVIELCRQRKRGDAPERNAVDLQAYELTLLNLAGRLDALNVWHLFHGLMGLKVRHMAPAPADADGTSDPTKWQLTVEATGCPAILRQKTKIVWGTETVWVHQQRAHVNPPCVRCGDATHMASSCSSPGPSHGSTVLTIAGPRLEVDDAIAAAKEQTPPYLNAWLKGMDKQLQERSMMGGEDKPAPVHVPTGLPVSLAPIYVTPERLAKRKRFYLRVKHMETYEVGLRILRRRALALCDGWLNHQLSFRLEVPRTTSTLDEEAYEEEMRFFRIIMSRPYLAGAQDEEARYNAAKAEDNDEMEEAPVSDSAFAAAVRRTWQNLRAMNHEQAAAAEAVVAQCLQRRADQQKQIEEAAAIKLAAAEAAARRSTAPKTATEAAREAAMAATMPEADVAPVVMTTQPSVVVACLKPSVMKKKSKKKSKVKAGQGSTTKITMVTSAPPVEVKSSLQAALEREREAGGDVNVLSNAAVHGERHVERRGYTDDEADEDLFEDMEVEKPRSTAVGEQWTCDSDVPGATRLPHQHRSAGLKGAFSKARLELKASPSPARLHRTKKHVTTRLTEYITVATDDGTLALTKAAIQKRTKTQSPGQLGINGFFSPRPGITPKPSKLTPAAPDVQFDAEKFSGDGTVAFMGVQAAPVDATEPPTWKAKKQRLGVREVNTLTNGHCFASAIVGVTYGTRPPKLLTRKFTREATHHHEAICELMLDYYSALTADGVIDGVGRCKAVSGSTDVTAEAVEMVLDDLERRRRISCETILPRQYWAGPEEIKAACLWLRRPLIVFDVMPDGRAWAVVYVICQRVMSGENMRETVDEHAMSFGEVSKLLDEFKAARVVPYVFALHHSVANGEAIGHFAALRVSDSRYAHSSSTAAQKAAMIARLDGLLRARGWYPTGTSPSYYEEGTRVTKPRLLPPTTEDASGSLYSPSEPTSSEREMSGSAPLSKPSTSATDGHGTPLFQASLVTPLSPLEDSDYIRLVEFISRPGPVRLEDEASLKKATRDNRTALGVWRKSIQHSHPSIANVIRELKTVEAVCQFLINDPQLLLSLLQSLPYVPVLAGRTSTRLFTAIGRALIALGRLHLLSQLEASASTPCKARKHCATWRLALAGLPNAEARWAMAQTKGRWDGLKALMQPAVLPAREINGLPDDAWGALIVHLLVSPSRLRDRLMQLPLAAACDTLLRWTASEAHAEATITAARALQNGLWLAPTEFLTELGRLSQDQLLVTVTPTATSGALHF